MFNISVNVTTEVTEQSLSRSTSTAAPPCSP